MNNKLRENEIYRPSRKLTFRSVSAVVKVATIGSLITLAGCSAEKPIDAATGTASNSNNASPAQPQPATVTRRDIVAQVALNGDIVVPPSARADILPPFRATVDKVDKTVGAAVTKGDILIQLSLPSAEAWHEQTKAALKQAEIDYANAKRQNNAPVVAAQRQVDAARAAANAAQQNSSTTYQPDGTVTTTTSPSTPSTPATGSTPTTPLASSSDIVTARAALQQAQADMTASLLPDKQRLEEARANNQQARAGEKQGNVRSPLTGTVITLNAQPGKEVGVDARQPVSTVVDLSAIQVQSSMDANQVSFVKPKMGVALTFDELPGKAFDGTVGQITTNPSTKRYVAVIQFKNRDAAVKPGMHPHVGVKTGGKSTNALAVPAAAVDKDSSGKWIVNVQRSGKWEKVPVEVGVSDGQFTEIKSGVKEGDTVQVTP